MGQIETKLEGYFDGSIWDQQLARGIRKDSKLRKFNLLPQRARSPQGKTRAIYPRYLSIPELSHLNE